MIRYDTRCYFRVRSIVDVRQLNLLCGTKKPTKSEKKEKNVLKHIGKQSGKSMESVLEKKRKATVGRICRKGRFKPGKND